MRVVKSPIFPVFCLATLVSMRDLVFRPWQSFIILIAFLVNTLGPICPISSFAAGESFYLPAPGSMVNLSPSYMPVIIKGLKVHPDNPLLFDFIVDTGSSKLKINSVKFKAESQKLIKYFLAALTIKEDNLWVNLSPYEKERIIPQELGQTEMGRDMLAQDYILKQLTASLIYPERALGKKFWDNVYAKARQMYGVTDIPVNTFNKVWIVADKAQVLERNNAALVVGAHMKVMLEEDYLALQKFNSPRRNSPHQGEGNSTLDSPPLVGGVRGGGNDTHIIASNIIRSIILPALEKEVNQGQNFAPLRQMFYSMILASWYKLALKNALLNQVYSNKAKTSGVLSDDPAVKEKIYKQYLRAYKKGVFNYIKEDIDTFSNQMIPRKYFSGGEVMNVPKILERQSILGPGDNAQAVGDSAMVTVGMLKQADVGNPETMKAKTSFTQLSWNGLSIGEMLALPEVKEEKKIMDDKYIFLSDEILSLLLMKSASIDNFRKWLDKISELKKGLTVLGDKYGLYLGDYLKNSLPVLLAKAKDQEDLENWAYALFRVVIYHPLTFSMRGEDIPSISHTENRRSHWFTELLAKSQRPEDLEIWGKKAIDLWSKKTRQGKRRFFNENWGYGWNTYDTALAQPVEATSEGLLKEGALAIIANLKEIVDRDDRISVQISEGEKELIQSNDPLSSDDKKERMKAVMDRLFLSAIKVEGTEVLAGSYRALEIFCNEYAKAPDLTARYKEVGEFINEFSVQGEFKRKVLWWVLQQEAKKYGLERPDPSLFLQAASLKHKQKVEDFDKLYAIMQRDILEGIRKSGELSDDDRSRLLGIAITSDDKDIRRDARGIFYQNTDAIDVSSLKQIFEMEMVLGKLKRYLESVKWNLAPVIEKSFQELRRFRHDVEKDINERYEFKEPLPILTYLGHPDRYASSVQAERIRNLLGFYESLNNKDAQEIMGELSFNLVLATLVGRLDIILFVYGNDSSPYPHPLEQLQLEIQRALSQAIIGSLSKPETNFFEDSYYSAKTLEDALSAIQIDGQINFVDGKIAVEEADKLISHKKKIDFWVNLIVNWQEPPLQKVASREIGSQHPESVMYAACDKLIDYLGEDKSSKILALIYKKTKNEALFKYFEDKFSVGIHELLDSFDIKEEIAETIQKAVEGEFPIVDTETLALDHFKRNDELAVSNKEATVVQRAKGLGQGLEEALMAFWGKEGIKVDDRHESLPREATSDIIRAQIYRRYGLAGLNPQEIRTHLLAANAYQEIDLLGIEALRSGQSRRLMDIELQIIEELILNGKEVNKVKKEVKVLEEQKKPEEYQELKFPLVRYVPPSKSIVHDKAMKNPDGTNLTLQMDGQTNEVENYENWGNLTVKERMDLPEVKEIKQILERKWNLWWARQKEETSKVKYTHNRNDWILFKGNGKVYFQMLMVVLLSNAKSPKDLQRSGNNVLELFMKYWYWKFLNNIVNDHRDPHYLLGYFLYSFIKVILPTILAKHQSLDDLRDWGLEVIGNYYNIDDDEIDYQVGWVYFDPDLLIDQEHKDAIEEIITGKFNSFILPGVLSKAESIETFRDWWRAAMAGIDRILRSDKFWTKDCMNALIAKSKSPHDLIEWIHAIRPFIDGKQWKNRVDKIRFEDRVLVPFITELKSVEDFDKWAKALKTTDDLDQWAQEIDKLWQSWIDLMPEDLERGADFDKRILPTILIHSKSPEDLNRCNAQELSAILAKAGLDAFGEWWKAAIEGDISLSKDFMNALIGKSISPDNLKDWIRVVRPFYDANQWKNESDRNIFEDRILLPLITNLESPNDLEKWRLALVSTDNLEKWAQAVNELRQSWIDLRPEELERGDDFDKRILPVILTKSKSPENLNRWNAEVLAATLAKAGSIDAFGSWLDVILKDNIKWDSDLMMTILDHTKSFEDIEKWGWWVPYVYLELGKRNVSALIIKVGGPEGFTGWAAEMLGFVAKLLSKIEKKGYSEESLAVKKLKTPEFQENIQKLLLNKVQSLKDFDGWSNALIEVFTYRSVYSRNIPELDDAYDPKTGKYGPWFFRHADWLSELLAESSKPDEFIQWSKKAIDRWFDLSGTAMVGYPVSEFERHDAGWGQPVEATAEGLFQEGGFAVLSNLNKIVDADSRISVQLSVEDKELIRNKHPLLLVKYKDRIKSIMDRLFYSSIKVEQAEALTGAYRALENFCNRYAKASDLISRFKEVGGFISAFSVLPEFKRKILWWVLQQEAQKYELERPDPSLILQAASLKHKQKVEDFDKLYAIMQRDILEGVRQSGELSNDDRSRLLGIALTNDDKDIRRDARNIFYQNTDTIDVSSLKQIFEMERALEILKLDLESVKWDLAPVIGKSLQELRRFRHDVGMDINERYEFKEPLPILTYFGHSDRYAASVQAERIRNLLGFYESLNSKDVQEIIGESLLSPELKTLLSRLDIIMYVYGNDGSPYPHPLEQLQLEIQRALSQAIMDSVSKQEYEKNQYEIKYHQATTEEKLGQIIKQDIAVPVGGKNKEAVNFLINLIVNWQDPDPILYAACDKLKKLAGGQEAARILALIYKNTKNEKLYRYVEDNFRVKLQELLDSFDIKEETKETVQKAVEGEFPIVDTETLAIDHFKRTDELAVRNQEATVMQRARGLGQGIEEALMAFLGKEGIKVDDRHESLPREATADIIRAQIYRRYGLAGLNPQEIRARLLSANAYQEIDLLGIEALRSGQSRRLMDIELQIIEELILNGKEVNKVKKEVKVLEEQKKPEEYQELKFPLVRYVPPVGSKREDKSMNAPGGIDLTPRNMAMDITKEGKGIEMTLDPAMLAEFQKGNFTGVQGIILRIVPIQNLESILEPST